MTLANRKAHTASHTHAHTLHCQRLSLDFARGNSTTFLKKGIFPSNHPCMNLSLALYIQCAVMKLHDLHDLVSDCQAPLTLSGADHELTPIDRCISAQGQHRSTNRARVHAP